MQEPFEEKPKTPKLLTITPKGTINGIWLTQKNGRLHKTIIPNVSSWVLEASGSNFQVVIWTNKNELDGRDIAELERNQVIVKDCSSCQSSRFYPVFRHFLEKGLRGDITAFALASDILRIAIFELEPKNDFCIYVDANDTVFKNLRDDLRELYGKMSKNALGFSFYLSYLPEDNACEFRNDVLIVLKKVNPQFFKDFFKAYYYHLKANYTKYYTPKTDKEAQTLANTITMQPYLPLFGVSADQGDLRVFTNFGPYEARRLDVHSKLFLQYERTKGNTWLPQAGLQLSADKSPELLACIAENEGYDNKCFSDILCANLHHSSVILSSVLSKLSKLSQKTCLSESGFLLSSPSAMELTKSCPIFTIYMSLTCLLSHEIYMSLTCLLSHEICPSEPFVKDIKNESLHFAIDCFFQRDHNTIRLDGYNEKNQSSINI